MKNATTIFIFLLMTGALFAQPPGGRPGMGGMPANGIIKGAVQEFASDKPMGYANVVLFSTRDSSMVAGTVTAMDGSFTLEKVPFGRFYLIANFIGFNKETVNDIRVTPKQMTVDLGTIKLHSSTENLEAVEITGQKEHIEYKIDRKVVNVSQDIMAQGGTAVNALENTPSVQVDIDGNVSLRGSSSFQVLIDGRPSVLEGSDALQQIPASNIDKIEIITNPSAKYDPDGVAGIINVILKEKIEKGFSGVINASAATNESYSTDFLLNYRYKKFNFFLGADYRDHNHSGTRDSRNENYIGDTTFYRNTFGDRSRGWKGYGVRAGFDYYLSDKTTIGVQGRKGYYDFHGGGISNLHEFTDPANTDTYSSTETTMKRSGDYYNASVNFQHKFDDNGHQIDASADFRTRTGDDADDQRQYRTDSDYNIIEDNPYYIRAIEASDDKRYRFNIDYAKPINEEGKFEAGVQARIEDETEDYIFRNWSYDDNDWVEDTLFSNTMDFNRTILSVYGIFSNKWNSFGYQLGLRGEYTDREIKNKLSAKPSVIDRWDYFPTIHLSKSFANDDQLLASYTRRIDRPRGWYLDPFVSFMDQYNFRQGNPDLEPEYTDSYELGYQKRIWGTFFSLEGYYRITNNKITRIRTLQDDGTFLHTFQNLNNDYSAGAELMARSNPAKWLDLTITGNLYHYRLKGTVGEENVDTESINWNGRLNAVVKLPKDIRLQINGMYFGPSVEAQGKSEGFFMTNAAVKKDFFDNHLTVTASIRDIFGTAKHEFTTTGPNFYSYDYFNRESQIVSLNLSWRINNYKTKMDRNGGDSGEPGMDNMDF